MEFTNRNTVLDYAQRHSLKNTECALDFIPTQAARFPDSYVYEGYFAHAIAICGMLIDLHVPVPRMDEDILLASALCHILPENIHYTDFQKELHEAGFDNSVYQTVKCIVRDDNQTPEQQRSFFDAIEHNRLALLVKLADRGNLVEQLHGISPWSARQYIYETRTFFFPMCIHAKEHFPELIPPVSVMMEKMRCLIEVAEILMSRYEAKENDLMLEILSLQEENAMLRSLLKQ